MYIWNRAKGRAHAAAGGQPTPLLKHLTGPYAPRIAGLWPQPHADFVGAPADRRHLICLALSRTDAQLDPELADQLLDLPLKAAVRVAMADAPSGLARALGRIGEVAWAAEDYARLVRLVGAPGTAPSIRHAVRIEPQQLHALEALPQPLREAGFGDKGVDGARAQLLSEVWVALVARDGEEAMRRRARVWATGATLNDRLEKVREDLIPEFPAAPFPGSDRLRLLGAKASLREAAGRYRNCLANYMTAAAQGDSAFYEWVGDPGAVVQITRDLVHGWTLCQARGRNNDETPRAIRHELVAELRAWGVHVGTGYWGYDNALARAQAATYLHMPAAQVVEDLLCD